MSIHSGTLEAIRFLENYGMPRPEYVGKFYDCEFDHEKNVFNTSIRHFHKIKEGWFIHRPHYIYHGIALELEDLTFIQFSILPKYILDSIPDGEFKKKG